MAAPLATPRTLTRAPITHGRRPRGSMCQRHTFTTASLPVCAGIPAEGTRRDEENR
jgi:hypothetical protein